MLRLQTQKLSEEKITVRFKLNLKTDGLDYKMIFKFGKRIERLHSCCKQCRRIYICELVGARPLHLPSQTVLSLKSPTGAFIAALRFANANLSGQGPSICCRRPFYRLKAPLGLSLLRCASQTRTFENTSLSAACKKNQGKFWQKERGLDAASPLDKESR